MSGHARTHKPLMPDELSRAQAFCTAWVVTHVQAFCRAWVLLRTHSLLVMGGRARTIL